MLGRKPLVKAAEKSAGKDNSFPGPPTAGAGFLNLHQEVQA